MKFEYIDACLTEEVFNSTYYWDLYEILEAEKVLENIDPIC